jgi:hypothetical protein
MKTKEYPINRRLVAVGKINAEVNDLRDYLLKNSKTLREVNER